MNSWFNEEDSIGILIKNNCKIWNAQDIQMFINHWILDSYIKNKNKNIKFLFLIISLLFSKKLITNNKRCLFSFENHQMKR